MSDSDHYTITKRPEENRLFFVAIPDAIYPGERIMIKQFSHLEKDVALLFANEKYHSTEDGKILIVGENGDDFQVILPNPNGADLPDIVVASFRDRQYPDGTWENDSHARATEFAKNYGGDDNGYIQIVSQLSSVELI